MSLSWIRFSPTLYTMVLPVCSHTFSPQRSRVATTPKILVFGPLLHALSLKAVVRDLGRTKSGKQKAAKEARKIVEMKGKQIKDELSLAMVQLFTKLLDEDSVEASTIDDVI